MINLADLVKETSSERCQRKHNEDVIVNPGRHKIKNDFYPYKEWDELCPICLEKVKDNYVHIGMIAGYRKKVL